MVSERLNTPALNIVVHLEFHSNFVKKLLKFIEIAKNYDIIHKTKQNLCYGYNMAEGEI